MPKLSPLGERVETGSFIADGRFSGWCIPGTSLSQIGTGEANKKGKFSILSRIDCWHWSLTSPYRMDLELLTKSVKHLTFFISNYRVGLWAISSFSLGQWFQIVYCPIFRHKPHANLNSLTKEWLPYVCGWFG